MKEKNDENAQATSIFSVHKKLLAKFQKDQNEIVGGVALTRYMCLFKRWMHGRTDGQRHIQTLTVLPQKVVM